MKLLVVINWPIGSPLHFKIFQRQILVRLNFGELTTICQIHRYLTPPIFCHVRYFSPHIIVTILYGRRTEIMVAIKLDSKLHFTNMMDFNLTK